ASMIDKEVKTLMTTAYNRTESILREHMDKLHEVAKFLYQNEKMSGEQFKEMMEAKGPEPPEEFSDGGQLSGATAE
ncbi:MAG: ATP-dependent zinc metalloprotease FtsH, partial [Ruminococcaceae bacterium]|nr:ATP-dependent zinc metalloprotease FtsH [Oscillospiraceae bacterium]